MCNTQFDKEQNPNHVKSKSHCIQHVLLPGKSPREKAAMQFPGSHPCGASDSYFWNFQFCHDYTFHYLEATGSPACAPELHIPPSLSNTYFWPKNSPLPSLQGSDPGDCIAALVPTPQIDILNLNNSEHNTLHRAISIKGAIYESSLQVLAQACGVWSSYRPGYPG